MNGDPLIPPPDTIEPRAPAEAPSVAWPPEGPGRTAPEYAPPVPDRYVPDDNPGEVALPQGLCGMAPSVTSTMSARSDRL